MYEAICTSKIDRKHEEVCKNEDLILTRIPGNKSASEMIKYIYDYLSNTSLPTLVQGPKPLIKVKDGDGSYYYVLDLKRLMLYLKSK